MGPDYKLSILGVQPDHTPPAVAARLAGHLRRPAEQLLPALAAREAITATLRGLPLQGARIFKETIDATGAVTRLDSTAPPPPAAAPLTATFDAIERRPMVNRAVGLVFHAPADWHDESDDKYLRIRHAGTKTWFTSSMNREPGFTLPVWAEVRFGAVAEHQAHFAPLHAPYSLDTAAGPAIAAEFRGTAPGDREATHMLVMVWRPSFGQLSLNIAATVPEYKANEALYQWLLRTQLRLFAGAADEALARAAKEHPGAQYDQAARLARAGRMKEAAPIFQRLADGGHVGAKRDLGYCYINGDGVPRDASRAFQLWREAAELGDPAVQYHLATLYDQGLGTPPDPVKAFHWMAKAADRGEPEAQFGLAVCYRMGKGVAMDLEAAGRCLLAAAASGHVNAQFYAGGMHESGEGLPRDREKALAWFRKAAAQGHEEARKKVAAMER